MLKITLPLKTHQNILSFWAIIVFAALSAPPLAAQKGTSKEPPSPKAEILSDKVYLYSYFKVLFKTPFPPEENVQIRTIDTDSRVLRNQTLDYSRYRSEDARELRAFILGFYTVAPGLHQLPRLRFQSVETGQAWDSPALAFASFQVDEGTLPLPVDVELNSLPKKVYLGQNIALNVWAVRVNAINQSLLSQQPEFTGFLVQQSPVKPDVEHMTILGQDAYRVSLGIWLLNPIKEGLLNIPAIPANVMGMERQTLARQLEVLPLPPNPFRRTSPRGPQEEPEGLENFGENRHAISNGPSAPAPLLQPASETAIGQFEIFLKIPKNKNSILPKAEVKEFSRNELIPISLRITGSGNIHLFSFPPLQVPAGLVLLQSDEKKSLDLDLDEAEILGWREKNFVY
ncbi:MAG: hypothetical protein AAF975_08655, partial [Spirochaetota bacterium]